MFTSFYFAVYSKGLHFLFTMQDSKQLSFKILQPWIQEDFASKSQIDEENMALESTMVGKEYLPAITSSFVKIANVLINDKYIKPLIFLGSERSGQIMVLNQTNLEIIFIFKFKGFKGGFTHGEIFGRMNF